MELVAFEQFGHDANGSGHVFEGMGGQGVAGGRGYRLEEFQFVVIGPGSSLKKCKRRGEPGRFPSPWNSTMRAVHAFSIVLISRFSIRLRAPNSRTRHRQGSQLPCHGGRT